MLIRHHRQLRVEDVTDVDGLRVTSVDRTVLDCVTMLPVDWALATADSALRLLVDPDRARPGEAEARAAPVRARWLAQLSEYGPRRGCRQARVLLAHADPLSESPGESRVRCLAIAEGLPAPTPQFLIETAQGRYYADFGWRLPAGSIERVAIVEFDGQEKYTVPGAMDAQKIREQAILETGARVERFVGNDLLLENRHMVSRRLRDLVPELPCNVQPVLHIRPQPARNRRRRPS
ncbi:hypothetical protein [Mobilicoccus massiliensis]|uniref:hypothetical protein n=1 Tax=Mobilicoccus massiliensis TaxID=1522310 RepID=UPI001141AC08|nr:hypothetical protein [Mobilicoccus massiliensis]